MFGRVTAVQSFLASMYVLLRGSTSVSVCAYGITMSVIYARTYSTIVHKVGFLHF